MGDSAQREAEHERATAELLQQRAARVEREADGKRLTARVLDGLPSEWTALHDRQCPGQGLVALDHVVIGPAGIFVIGSASWEGTASLAGGIVRENGRAREEAVAGVADAAIAFAELVGTEGGDVQGILCLAGAARIAGRSRDVVVCSTDALAQVLLARPHIVSSEEASDLAFRLDLQLPSAVPVVPAPPRRGPAGTSLRLAPAGTPLGRLAPASGEPSRGAFAELVEQERRRALEWQQQHQRQLRREQRRMRSRQVRKARRFAQTVLLLVVLVIFGPAASSIAVDVVRTFAVGTVPVAPVPTPSPTVGPTTCPQGATSGCSSPGTAPPG